MGVTCHILIHRPREGVHKAGRPVRGKVRYAIDEVTEYKDITLSLVGKGESVWRETKRNTGTRINGAGKNRNYTKTYTGTDVFIENYISILKPGFTGVLPAGTYEYHFQFMLPEDIPPSFHNGTCTIAYQIGQKFEKPTFFSFNKKYTTTINAYGNVKPIINAGHTLFGLEKSLLRPFSKRNHMINVKGDIHNTFFTPGQNADISFNVTNNTDVTITSLKTELISYTTYIANCGRMKHEVNIIKGSTVETPSVPPNAVANMSSVVPILAHLYSIQHCTIMQKEYKVKVTLRLPIPYINADVELPIVIGEKRDDINTDVAFVASAVPGPSAEVAMGGGCYNVEAVGSEGPPSYWEVMNEDLEEKEEKEND